jgi:rubrerythrin
MPHTESNTRLDTAGFANKCPLCLLVKAKLEEALALMAKPAADAKAEPRREIIIAPADLAAHALGVLGLCPETQLEDLLRSYPADWIHRALSIAIGSEKTGGAYLRGILKRWKKEGRPDDEATGRKLKPAPPSAQWLCAKCGESTWTSGSQADCPKCGGKRTLKKG